MRKTLHACCSAIAAVTLLSACCPLACSAQPQNATDTNHLVLKYKELLKPLSSSEIRKVEGLEPVPSYPLLKRYSFLRLRPKETILKGKQRFSGKGEEWKSEVYLLETDHGAFQLGLYGTEEFVHFNWKVTTDNAEMLFRGIIRAGPGIYIVPIRQYDHIRERIGAKYPDAVVNRQPVAIAPPRLVTQSGHVYVHCEAIVYVRDGIYFDEGSVENSFVKYATDLGNGFVKSEIEVLVRGPYCTDPLYWHGVNRMEAPSDEKERKAIIQEFERMKEFQKFAQDLLGKTEGTDAK